MSDPHNAHAIWPKLRHERPFLYAWNRRLRHLHGISLRNLNTTPVLNKTRRKTITDDDAPYNHPSPAKSLFQNEQTSLSQSRSFTNLSGSSQKPPLPSKASASHEKNGKLLARPAGGNLRRRSTLQWSSASPRVRQQKLEDVASNRLADTWFSIHNVRADEPIYVSEVIEKCMNPDFAFFDLDFVGAQIARVDECTIKLWAKDDRMDEYAILVEWNLNLRSLQYIGKSLESFHHPLPPNCILLHLSDGIYTSFTDLPSDDHSLWRSSKESKASQEANTSSFDALMQLGDLDECVQDALLTRARLEDDINKILSDKRASALTEQKEVEQHAHRAILRTALDAEQKQTKQIQKKKAELRKSLAERRTAMKDVKQKDEHNNQDAESLKKSSKSISLQLNRIRDESAGQIRRITESLLQVYPIEPLKNRTLQFTVRNIHLPNSTFDDTNRDEIAAALGFTAQLVSQLSLYMCTPLPYPLDPNASNSFVRDPISVGIAQRKFPLHPTNIAYKFEYGVFLLNKDIEFLMSRSGLRVLDIRHTLPNIKYLVYVLTAGSGELPARKAGGVRGLTSGRMTPSMSRRGSDDSVHSQSDYIKRGSVQMARSAAPLAIPREKDGNVDDPFYASPRAIGLPYRPSGLRDAG